MEKDRPTTIVRVSRSYAEHLRAESERRGITLVQLTYRLAKAAKAKRAAERKRSKEKA